MSDFTKIAKINLFSGSDMAGIAKDLPLEIEFHQNKILQLKTVNKELKVPREIQQVIIGIIKDGSDKFKYRLYRDKVGDRGDGIWIKFYGNKNHLSELCSEYAIAPYIINMIIRQSGRPQSYADKPAYDETNVPLYKNPTELSCNYGEYLKIVPYDYQYNNIWWLRQVEENIDRGFQHFEYVKLDDLLYLRTKKLEFYLDPDTDILYDVDSLWGSDYRRSRFDIKGGVLCDEVGLGKTLSMTGLIIGDKFHIRPSIAGGGVTVRAPKSRPEPEPIAQQTGPDPDPKPKPTGPVKIKVSTKIKKKVSIVKRTTPLPKKELEPPTPTDTSTEKSVSTEREQLWRSNATLVMCPRRLVAQWITEIEKYTNKLRVIEMSTMIHVKKYDYADMDNVDVVVVSFSLLDNKNYLKQDAFNLDAVHWRRVIIDEGHEVLLHNHKKKVADARISQGIFSIKSTYRWICTGTPLANTYESLQAILSYLNDLGHNEPSPLLNNISMEDYPRLMELLFHRNTRESVNTPINIPEHEETVEFLEFTGTERAIYDSIDPADTTRRLQVCTNLSVSETDNEISGGSVLTLEESTKAMGGYYMDKCTRTEDRIKAYRAKIEQVEENRDEEIGFIEEDLQLAKDKDEIAEMKAERTRIKNNARNKISGLRDRIANAKEELEGYRKQLQIFRALDTSHIKKSTCPIMGCKLNGMVAITPDGYYYSQQGVELLFLGGRKAATCPLSKNTIDKDQLTYVDTNKQSKSESESKSESKTDEEPDEEIDMERSKWGTKMSRVLQKLRQIQKGDPDGKIIIFSQWTKMLMLMAKALKDGNIKHVFCRGNVHMMSKSIRMFKTDPETRVILLSSDSCNSGSNLTEAGYVFLIDAVSGDIEQARAAETQAIARTRRLGQTKTVQVYRFVMKDTVEETYYKALQA